MKLSDYVAKFLVENKVHHVFQVIGGASVHLVHSLDNQDGMNVICVQHEQAAAMAAEAYSRLTKNMGVAMATSGPGMTNLLTGIACAYFDSIPTLFITGQVNTFESRGDRKVRQIGFQETDIAEIVKPITKYSVRVDDARNIKYELEKAVSIAKEGRQGPVLVDIPMDIQRADINPQKLKGFKLSIKKTEHDSKEQVLMKVKKGLALLMKAKRPVLIAGGAIRYSDSVEEFLKLASSLNIPVVTTWSGIDTVAYENPLLIGQIGVYGNRAANFTIQNSDVILSLGSRLDTRITGGKPETFARAAKKIVIDIDKAELYKRRGLTPDIGICADVKEVIKVINKEIKNLPKNNVNEWIKITKKWKEKYPNILPEWRKLKNKVNPYYFMETLSQTLDKNATVITDCGGNLTWTIQGFKVKQGQRLISAMGNSPMAYSLPASMGASIALGKKPVICIIGDGGLQMNIQELQTIVHYKLPVKIFIINNHSYGIIKQFQEMYFEGKYVATTPNSGYSMPDFIKIGNAYGLKTAIIDNHVNLAEKINKVIADKGPVLCDVIIPDGSKLIPKLSFGNPIEDLSPELPRDEFKSNMIIKPL